jgi:hypothetical protein
MFHLSCPSQLLRLLLRGPRLWEEGGLSMWFSLVPALDPQSSGGRGQAPSSPFFGGKPWRRFGVSCPVEGCHPFSRREGLFRWSSSRLFLGWGMLRRCSPFHYPCPFPAGSRLLVSFAGSASPFPVAGISAPLARGPWRGPFRSLSFPDSSRRLFIALLDFPFVAWRRPKRPPCLLLRGLGDVLSFKVFCSQVLVP